MANQVTPSASSSRLPSKLRSHELSSFITGTTGTQSSITTTPTGRRLAARQLFEQYGISRPSEPHSVGVGRRRKRVCHVCGDQVVLQSYCTTCGHPMCGRCRRAERGGNQGGSVGNGQPAQVGIRASVGTGGEATAGRGARQIFTGPGGEAEMTSVSAAIATGSPTTVIGSSLGKGEISLESMVENSREEVQEETNSKPAGGELANVGKKDSVKQNPFIIADQAAKAKSQVTTIHVIATPPSKPPKYDLTPDIRHVKQHSSSPFRDPSTSQQNPEVLLTPSSSQVSLPSPTTTGSETSSAAPRSPARSSVVPSPVQSLVKDSQTSPVKSPQTPPVLRRFEAVAQKSGQNFSQAQRGPTVDVESCPASRGDRGVVPRVRVTSPPAWLKGAGVFTPIRQQPTVRRRWSWEEKGENNGIDTGLEGGNTKGIGLGAGDEGNGRESLCKSSMATVLEVRDAKRVNEESGESQRSPRDGTSPVTAKGESGAGGIPRLNAQNIARVHQSQTQQQMSPTWSHIAPEFWKLPPSTQPVQEAAQLRDTRDLHPKMSSRGSEMAVTTTTTATGTKGESVISEEFTVQDAVEEDDEDEEDDVGLQGLTIVLHLKGRDDLVISTDFTNAVGSRGLAGGLRMNTGAGGVRSRFVAGGGGGRHGSFVEHGDELENE
ncbi:hypothetical protein QBC43DRAFT_289913 [Cladorrhinum sp. PSN259]|nr:hypothetical protein QBC43DRAFT_289913 [Cladorrhinum sp. PSN259]